MLVACERASSPGGAHAPGPAPAPPDPRVAQALAEAKEGRPQRALEVLAPIIEQGATDPGALFAAGLAHHLERRYEAARALFDRALAADPSPGRSAQIHHFRGWCLYHLGKREEARRSFESHLATEPDAASSWFGLARVAQEGGRTRRAVEHVRRAIELESSGSARPDRLARYHATLGDLLLAENLLDEAARELERAASLAPDSPSIQYKLYGVATRQGDLHRASEHLVRYRAALERRLSSPEDGP